jgi:hypothetical protein
MDMKKEIVGTKTAVFCSLCAVGVAPLARPAAAGASAQPAALQALEQKMSSLQVSSERVDAAVSISARKLPRKLRALRGLSVVDSVEASTTPPAASLTTKARGQTVTARVVGEDIYIDEPALAARDGGRPWVEESATAGGKSPDANSGIGGGSSTPFESLASTLSAGTHVRELGTSTIEGQPVTGFAMKIAPEKLEASQLPSKLRASVRRSHLSATGKLEEFIAADGLPVRSVETLRIGSIRLKVSADILAVDFPLTISAPAASETITLPEVARLKKKPSPRAKS